jgi:hypothetical protein
MKRREFMGLLAAGAGAMLTDPLAAAEPAATRAGKRLIGMYVHEGWSYNRPYAPRAWTDDDWHGYLEGLSHLGYNMFSFWPQIEVMPKPLTPSDQAKLDQHRRVIDMAHREFGMKVWVTLCPNVAPIDDYARRVPFENRLFYASDLRVNPADRQAMDAMMARRELLLKPLAAMDGLVIIDSDPGGYPNSTNKEFVDLLVRHRQLLDRLRPGGIELVYWMWAGWQAYARYYSTGDFVWQTEPEFVDALTLLKDRNPEPWGIANGWQYAAKLGLQSKVVSFNYGAIELEPVLPVTNFGPHAGGDPYASGKERTPRGNQANAQTHCVQLPGTFAFAQGARGLPLTNNDYLRFANDLIVGQGAAILAGWQAIGGMDSGRMRHAAAALAPLAKAKLEPGPLRGLLFGDASRFIRDLYMMLRLKAACSDFMAAADQGRPVFIPLTEFVSWLDRWSAVTGYQGWWGWAAGGNLNASLQKLKSPLLDDFFKHSGLTALKNGVGTPQQRITALNCANETETLRLIRILKQELWGMDPRYPNSSING